MKWKVKSLYIKWVSKMIRLFKKTHLLCFTINNKRAIYLHESNEKRYFITLNPSLNRIWYKIIIHNFIFFRNISIKFDKIKFWYSAWTIISNTQNCICLAIVNVGNWYTQNIRKQHTIHSTCCSQHTWVRIGDVHETRKTSTQFS